MNFTIDNTAFRAAADAAARAADPKSPSDLLRMTLIRTTPNTVEIFASNMTLAIATRVPAMVLAPGEICLPAKELKESLAALPQGEVNFELRPGTNGDQRAFLKAGRRTAQLPTVSADGFPPFAPEPATWLPLPAATLLGLFRFTKHAVCEDTSRPHLCGVRVDRAIGAPSISGTSTDGHRLARIELPIEPGAALAVTVPLDAVNEILKAIESRPEAVTVSIAADSSACFAKIGDVTVFARLTANDGFPPAKRVIPESRARAARVARAAMAEVVHAMLKINKADSAGVKLSITPSTIDVRTTADGASGQDLVDCELEGKPLEIGFNGRYLGDALDAFTGSEVVLEFGDDALMPGVVRSPDASGSLVVIMPMRI